MRARVLGLRCRGGSPILSLPWIMGPNPISTLSHFMRFRPSLPICLDLVSSEFPKLSSVPERKMQFLNSYSMVAGIHRALVSALALRQVAEKSEPQITRPFLSLRKFLSPDLIFPLAFFDIATFRSRFLPRKIYGNPIPNLPFLSARQGFRSQIYCLSYAKNWRRELERAFTSRRRGCAEFGFDSLVLRIPK